MHFLIFALLLASSVQVQGKAVFAHFMLSNAENFTTKDWESDISQAKEAKIDAFALNYARHESPQYDIMQNAFTTAADLGFKLFFSFDYAGNGSWPIKQITDVLGEFGPHPAYYQHDNKPLVSTFEGAENKTDWIEIKKKTDCFFIPDWSSVGPKVAANNTFVDGLFSWGAWPEGPRPLNTSNDKAYQDALDGRPYMMPVSPWFYTNLPGFDKNWVWRGDDLWYTRWEQVMDLQPEFVQIISWNDYGESHYIGPLWDKAMNAFSQGKAPFNYVTDMPHDGWRTFLPYVIEQYKTNKTAPVTEENVVTWYRLHPAKACSDGGTVGNSPGQKKQKPDEVVQDKVFFSALLDSKADVSVSFGGNAVDAKWESEPKEGRGVYFGSVPFKDGDVEVTVKRGGETVASVKGEKISSDCKSEKGLQNYNAWVGTSGAAELGLAFGLAWLWVLVVGVLI